MKFLKLLALSLTLTFAPIQKSEAAVAGVAAIAGYSVAATNMAIAGLATAGGGVVVTYTSMLIFNCSEYSCLGAMFYGAFFGVILLDEEQGGVSFSMLDEDSTIEDSKEAWSRYSDVLSHGSFNVLKVLASAKK